MSLLIACARCYANSSLFVTQTNTHTKLATTSETKTPAVTVTSQLCNQKCLCVLLDDSQAEAYTQADDGRALAQMEKRKSHWRHELLFVGIWMINIRMRV